MNLFLLYGQQWTQIFIFVELVGILLILSPGRANNNNLFYLETENNSNFTSLFLVYGAMFRIQSSIGGVAFYENGWRLWSMNHFEKTPHFSCFIGFWRRLWYLFNKFPMVLTCGLHTLESRPFYQLRWSFYCYFCNGNMFWKIFDLRKERRLIKIL